MTEEVDLDNILKIKRKRKVTGTEVRAARVDITKRNVKIVENQKKRSTNHTKSTLKRVKRNTAANLTPQNEVMQLIGI